MKTADGKELFEECNYRAYFGDFYDDYDHDVIIDEATYVDYKSGNRYMRDDVDFDSIVAAHEISK